MKKAFWVLLIFINIIFLCGCSNAKNQDELNLIQKRGKLIVGVKFDSKPFGYLNKNGNLEGMDIDIAKKIAYSIFRNENKIEFKQVNAQDRISKLNSKEVDIIVATMSVNSKRSAVVDFSDPYFISGQSILVSKNSKIKSIGDLENKKVIIVLGSTSEKTLKELAPNSIVYGVKTYTEGFRELRNNKAQAMLADEGLLYSMMFNNSNFKILPKRYTQEYYAIALRKGPENSRLKERINFVLNNINDNGVLNRIKQKNFPKNN